MSHDPSASFMISYTASPRVRASPVASRLQAPTERGKARGCEGALVPVPSPESAEGVPAEAKAAEAEADDSARTPTTGEAFTDFLEPFT